MSADDAMNKYIDIVAKRSSGFAATINPSAAQVVVPQAPVISGPDEVHKSYFLTGEESEQNVRSFFLVLARLTEEIRPFRNHWLPWNPFGKAPAGEKLERQGLCSCPTDS